MKLSLIIPCFNEKKNIKPFIECCLKIFSDKKDIEYIFINDGSKDNTYKEIKSIINKYDKENIICINFSRNFGKEAAMLAGLKKSRGEYTAIIDADLQQHPKYVKEMLKFIENNPDYDCVTCYQEKRKESKIISFFKEKFYIIINKFSDVSFYKNASDFRLFNRDVLNSILELKEYYRFSKGIFSYIGFNTYYMPYEVLERKNGKSSWSIYGLIKYAINGILSFSLMPLKLATSLGMITLLISIIYIIIKFIKKITLGIVISQYSVIIWLLLILSGIQMILLSIIGEYLGRIFIEIKKRPSYIIKDVYSKKTEK